MTDETRIMIEVAPTWEGTMRMLLAVVQDGTTEGRKLATAELMDLARKVDTINAQKIPAAAVANDALRGELAEFMTELFACYAADGEYNTYTAPLGTIEIRGMARELGRKLGVTFDNDEGE